MFNAVNILEALKNYIRTRGGTSNAYNIAEAVNDLNSIPQGSGGDIPPEVTNAIETGGMGWTETESQEGFDIQWDGNTEGLERVSGIDADFFKISDLDVPNDQLIGLKIDTADLNTHEVLSTEEITEEFINEREESGSINNDYASLGPVIIVHIDGLNIEGYSFTHKGIYAADPGTSMVGGIYTSRLYKEASTEEVVHQIDQKYIPSGGGGSNLFVLHINASIDENEELVFTSDETYQDCLDAITSGKVACAVLHILNDDTEQTHVYNYFGPAFYAGANEEGALAFGTVFSYSTYEGEFDGRAWRIWFTPQNTLEDFYSIGLG